MRYHIHSIINQSYQESDVLGVGPTAEFQWIDIENLTEFRACRNSIQGALLIVDERGKGCICTTVNDLKSKIANHLYIRTGWPV